MAPNVTTPSTDGDVAIPGVTPHILAAATFLTTTTVIQQRLTDTQNAQPNHRGLVCVLTYCGKYLHSLGHC